MSVSVLEKNLVSVDEKVKKTSNFDLKNVQ